MSPSVPISMSSLENKIMTRKESIVSKKQKLKNDNTESSKNVGMRKRKHKILIHGKINSKQYHKRKESKNIETCRKYSKRKFNGHLKNYLCSKCGLNFDSKQSLRIH